MAITKMRGVTFDRDIGEATAGSIADFYAGGEPCIAEVAD